MEKSMPGFSVITAAAVNGLPATAECLRLLERRRGNVTPEKLSSLRLPITMPDSVEKIFMRQTDRVGGKTRVFRSAGHLFGSGKSLPKIE